MATIQIPPPVWSGSGSAGDSQPGPCRTPRWIARPI